MRKKGYTSRNDWKNNYIEKAARKAHERKAANLKWLAKREMKREVLS